MSSTNIIPALRYKNGTAAVDFLATAFGFEKLFVAPGAEGGIAHAEMTFGSGVIMLGAGTHEPPSPWDTVAQGVYVHVADVDAHYARAKAAGAEIVSELRDTPYGSREYSARDPEGHLWAFGTYLPKR